MEIEDNLLHPSKIPCPNDVTDDGIVTEVRLLQSLKHSNPNDVTDEGMVMDAKL